MQNEASDFSYVLCPGSRPNSEHLHIYQKVYACWNQVWTEAFRELKINKHLHSDAFSRQDYIGALFHKDTCVALCFFRWVDSKLSGFADDSYFSNWEPQHLKALSSRGDKIIVCSYFTVHPEVRRKQVGHSVKDLICGLLVETFMNSEADAMTGAVRVDRNVNALTSRWGSVYIDKDIESGYGDTVDLVGFFKDHINNFERPMETNFVKSLWQNRLVIPRMNLDNEFNGDNVISFPSRRAA